MIDRVDQRQKIAGWIVLLVAEMPPASRRGATAKLVEQFADVLIDANKGNVSFGMIRDVFFGIEADIEKTLAAMVPAAGGKAS